MPRKPKTMRVKGAGALMPAVVDPHASYGEARAPSPVREIIFMEEKPYTNRPLQPDPYLAERAKRKAG